MASVWGGSWWRSWGNAWGSIVVGLCAYDNDNPYDNAYEYDAAVCPVVIPPQPVPQNVGGGGPDPIVETPEDHEHLERQAEFKRRLYEKPKPVEIPVTVSPPSGATPELAPPPIPPSPEVAVPFYSTDSIASDLSAARQAIDAIVDDVRKKRDEEEALLLILLDSVS